MAAKDNLVQAFRQSVPHPDLMILVSPSYGIKVRDVVQLAKRQFCKELRVLSEHFYTENFINFPIGYTSLTQSKIKQLASRLPYIFHESHIRDIVDCSRLRNSVMFIIKDFFEDVEYTEEFADENNGKAKTSTIEQYKMISIHCDILGDDYDSPDDSMDSDDEAESEGMLFEGDGYDIDEELLDTISGHESW